MTHLSYLYYFIPSCISSLVYKICPAVHWSVCLSVRALTIHPLNCLMYVHVHLFVLVTDYVHSGKKSCKWALTGRAHCQRQVCIFFLHLPSCKMCTKHRCLGLWKTIRSIPWWLFPSQANCIFWNSSENYITDNRLHTFLFQDGYEHGCGCRKVKHLW